MLNTTTFENLNQKVRAAWDARWSGNLEATLKQLPELSAAFRFQLLGQESFEAERDWTLGNREARNGLLESDAILLVASILRIQGKFAEAKEVLERALKCLHLHGLSGSFRFHFERGLLQYVQGYSLSALEDFFSAERMTNEPLFRLIALSNALFCMENCGISHASVLNEITQLRKTLKLSEHGVFHANERQLLAYEMRTHARLGEFKKALKVLKSDTRVTGQADFYHRYLRLIPYTTHYEPMKKPETEGLVRESEAFYQKGFLTRTLIGQTHANDDDTTKISDRIDRLYLWTWNWLHAPDSFPVERLLYALNNALEGFDPNRLTLEDRALLKNSLGWLELIDPSLKSKTSAISKTLTEGANIPLFDFEWTIIQTLVATKNKQTIKVKDTVQSLKQNPLWNSREIELSKLVSDVKHPLRIRLLAGSGIQKPIQKNGLKIDLNTFTLEVSELKVVSEAMCKAIVAFQKSSHLRCDTFFTTCFGLAHYDEFTHLPKINNLLARIKKLSKQKISFSVRSGTITFKTDSDYTIQVIEPTPLTDALRAKVLIQKNAHFPEKTKTRDQLKVASIMSAFASKPHFKREDAQVVLQKSKSSANRFLELLITRKIIVRMGTGPSATYSFKRESA